MKTVGKKLQDLRNAYGLTQGEFADKLGVTRASINGYENNVNPLSENVKFKIAQATGIGFEYFDTKMSLDEAFEKFGISKKNLELKDLQISLCNYFESVSDFEMGRYLMFDMKNWVLKTIFSIDFRKFKHLNFVEIDSDEFAPYAKKGEILLVVRSKDVANNDKIIIDFKGNLMIVEYFKEFGDITLQMNQKRTFTESDFQADIKILGIIKGKLFQF